MLRPLRTGPLRALALLVQVVVLACQLVEGTGREHCAHHDMGAATPAMAMATGHHHGASHGDSNSHSCRCLGDCHSAMVVAPAPEAAPLPQGRTTRLSTPTLAAPPSVDSQFRLPPSIGPPLSA